jgi:pantoate--beta-alanine ligase
MDTARTAAQLRTATMMWGIRDRRIGFVPTMGALHAGHLALVRRAAELSDRVVASVFVNPTQFGPGEDYGGYPRDPERDAALLAEAGCDLLFLPDVDTVYPPGDATVVDVAGPPAEGLEAAHRPGHFKGVAAVLTRLFHLVGCEVAVFGEKDAQQLAVVRRLVHDLHFPVEIVAHPTVREPDGLAMSSRNAYLDAAERRAAPALYRALSAAREAIAEGERDAGRLRAAMRAVLDAEPLVTPEYAEVVDAETFRPVTAARGRLVLPVAARVGRARLIDNLQLEIDGAAEAPR